MRPLVFIFVWLSFSFNFVEAKTVTEFFSQYPQWVAQDPYNFPTEVIAKNLNGTGDFKLGDPKDSVKTQQHHEGILQVVALTAKKNAFERQGDPEEVLNSFMRTPESMKVHAEKLHNAILGTLMFISLQEMGSGLQKTTLLKRLETFGYKEDFISKVIQKYGKIYTVLADLKDQGREVLNLGMDPKDPAKTPKEIAKTSDVGKNSVTGQIYAIDPASGNIVKTDGDISTEMSNWFVHSANLMNGQRPSSVQLTFHSTKGWLPQQWSVLKAFSQIEALGKKDNSKTFFEALTSITTTCNKAQAPFVLSLFQQEKGTKISASLKAFSHFKVIAPVVSASSAALIEPLGEKVQAIITNMHSLQNFPRQVMKVENLTVSQAFHQVAANPFMGWNVTKKLSLNRSTFKILKCIVDAKIQPEILELSIDDLKSLDSAQIIKKNTLKTLKVTVYEKVTADKINEAIGILKPLCNVLELKVLDHRHKEEVKGVEWSTNTAQTRWITYTKS